MSQCMIPQTLGLYLTVQSCRTYSVLLCDFTVSLDQYVDFKVSEKHLIPIMSLKHCRFEGKIIVVHE